MEGNLMELSENLENIFIQVKEHLNELDNIREKLLQIQRPAIRTCSEIIKHVHRQEWEKIPEKIKIAQDQVNEMKKLISSTTGSFPKDYLQIVKQEFGEAVIFYNLLKKNSLPSIEELGISPIDYAYALADVIGELRRYVLKCIRKEEVQEAEAALQYMDEIFSNLFTLDYPSGLIPGLRKKIDAGRRILANTEGDLSVSINIVKLKNQLLKRKLEETRE
jgi:translin